MWRSRQRELEASRLPVIVRPGKLCGPYPKVRAARGTESAAARGWGASALGAADRWGPGGAAPACFREGTGRPRAAHHLQTPATAGRARPPPHLPALPAPEAGKEVRSTWALSRRRPARPKMARAVRRVASSLVTARPPEWSVVTSACLQCSAAWRQVAAPVRARTEAWWPAAAASRARPCGQSPRSTPTDGGRISESRDIRRGSCRTEHARRPLRPRTPRRSSNMRRNRAGPACGPPTELHGRKWRSSGCR